jgi:hypothetical protein
MFAGWTRAIVVVAIAAFLGNAQCLGHCASSACSSVNSSPKGCHHHKQSDGDLARCTHQHSDFAGPETSLAKIAFIATVGIPLAVTANLNVVSAEHSILLPLDTGPPPPARSVSSISILRI